jgi:hypothetical protein
MGDLPAKFRLGLTIQSAACSPSAAFAFSASRIALTTRSLLPGVRWPFFRLIASSIVLRGTIPLLTTSSRNAGSTPEFRKEMPSSTISLRRALLATSSERTSCFSSVGSTGACAVCVISSSLCLWRICHQYRAKPPEFQRTGSGFKKPLDNQINFLYIKSYLSHSGSPRGRVHPRQVTRWFRACGFFCKGRLTPHPGSRAG